MSEKAVSLNDLTIVLGGNKVLEGIDMEIQQKEIVAVVGPNGAGKTTLLRAIMGCIKPTGGRIKVFGETPAKARSKSFFGYVPQSSQYEKNFPLSAFDVVSLSRYAKKRYFEKLDGADSEIISDSLNTVGMTDNAVKRFGDLSGGQRQRVLIARALAVEPKILVLDEPSTGLDTVAQDAFYKLLAELREKKNLTVILVSHDIGAVSYYIDTVACLNRKMHFHGKLEGCLQDENIRKLFGDNVKILVHDENCATCRRRNAGNP